MPALNSLLGGKDNRPKAKLHGVARTPAQHECSGRRPPTGRWHPGTGGEAAPNGAALAAADAQEHEVRVFPGFHDGSENLTLRCSCGEVWNLEPGHTAAELNIFAVQHAGGTQ